MACQSAMLLYEDRSRKASPSTCLLHPSLCSTRFFSANKHSLDCRRYLLYAINRFPVIRSGQGTAAVVAGTFVEPRARSTLLFR